MIRKFQESDWKAILGILKDVEAGGDSYFFLDMKDEDFRSYWIKENFACFVFDDGQIRGSYILGPVEKGRFSHIANASYVVSKNARGMGIGKLLGLNSIEFAKSQNYKGMQFNRVVSTNDQAVELWQSLGFKIIGTSPMGFNHKELGFVDYYMMYRNLYE